MQPSFLLVEILNQSPPAFLHLSEAALETEPVGHYTLILLEDLLLLLLLLFRISAVLRVPHIVSNEFLKGMSPMVSEILLSDITNRSHQSLDIFN